MGSGTAECLRTPVCERWRRTSHWTPMTATRRSASTPRRRFRIIFPLLPALHHHPSAKKSISTNQHQKFRSSSFFLYCLRDLLCNLFCRVIRAPSRNLQDLIHEVRCPRVCHGTERSSGDSPVSIDSFQRESARNPMSTSFSLDLPPTPRCLSLFPVARHSSETSAALARPTTLRILGSIPCLSLPIRACEVLACLANLEKFPPEIFSGRYRKFALDMSSLCRSRQVSLTAWNRTGGSYTMHPADIEDVDRGEKS